MKQSLFAKIAATILVFIATAAVAAEKVEPKTQVLKKLARPSAADINSPNGGAVMLTGAQCTGLGGKEEVFFKCFPNLACTTVDPAGVIRKVCITGTN